MLQSTTNRRRRLRRDLHGHESARGEFGRSALQESVPLRHRLGVVQRAQREPVCARIVLQAPTGPQGRLNVRQPELLPLRHHLPRYACSSSITMRSLQLSAAARKNGVYGAVTFIEHPNRIGKPSRGRDARYRAPSHRSVRAALPQAPRQARRIDWTYMVCQGVATSALVSRHTTYMYNVRPPDLRCDQHDVALSRVSPVPELLPMLPDPFRSALPKCHYEGGSLWSAYDQP